MLQDYKLTFRVAESYVGRFFDTAYYAETLGSYGLMTSGGRGKPGGGQASLFATKFDQHKHAGLTIDNTVFAWQQPRSTRVSTNQPRTIGWRSKRVLIRSAVRRRCLEHLRGHGLPIFDEMMPELEARAIVLKRTFLRGNTG